MRCCTLFPELERLRENWQTIRDEGLRLFDKGYIRAAETDNDLGFKSFFRAGSLHYHLGLVTPNADTCKIFIDGEPYYWKDGEDVLFDETFIHYAENRSDVTRLILFCDVERPMKVGLMTRYNRFMASTLVRASKTQNVEGEPVGILNRVFGYAYRVRRLGKWLKAQSHFAYYAVKYAIIGALLYWIFLS